MPKFVTIQNLEQYNSKINPRIQDLEQVSDLGYLVNYIKQTQPVTYTVELDGKTYTYKASAEQSESLPKLSDIEDYYGFSQIKEDVETIKNANYLPLSGGNVTGNLTVQDKNVVRSVNGVEADAEGNVQIGFPSDTFINVDFSTNSSFTAPANGFLNVTCENINTTMPSSFAVHLSNRTVNHWIPTTGNSSESFMFICTPIRKGESCHLTYSNSVFVSARFIYAEGEI